MSRVAVIDLGTNTFHLLIAEITRGKLTVVHKEKRAVKIGEGGIDQGLITETSFARGLDALKDFAGALEDYGVGTYQATATSAFRNASNQEDIVNRIFAETGIHVKVISGQEEAQLIFEGVQKAIEFEPDDISLIIDIGGGSVEFIICSQREILWKESFEIGGQRLMNRFHQNDPIHSEDLQSLYNFIASRTSALDEAVSRYEPTILVGASGTFDTLVELFHKRNNMLFALDNQTEYSLPLQDYNRIHQDLVLKNREERLATPGMIPMRVDMIVVGSALINYLLLRYELKNIKTSTYALKEGVIYRLLDQQALQ